MIGDLVILGFNSYGGDGLGLYSWIKAGPKLSVIQGEKHLARGKKTSKIMGRLCLIGEPQHLGVNALLHWYN